METISILKQNAVRAYEVADSNTKEVLKALLGEDIKPGPITDRVKTFDDVLRISGKTMGDIVQLNDTVDEIAYKKAKLIAEVYNEGTVLDSMNTNQYKYYPWHEINPGSGVGLSYGGCDLWASLSYVGVRLCFKSSALAIDAGKKFLDIYADLKIK